MGQASRSQSNEAETTSAPTATLADVDIRPLLAARPRRAPDFEEEDRAYGELAREMAENPGNLLQKLVEVAVDLCRADTAGLSLLEGDVFRWEAVAGVFAAYRGGTMPRDQSPCGVCIDRDAVQLMHLADRCFPALLTEPRFVEALLVPFHHHGRPIGTVWVVSHNAERKFDREDERIVRVLTRFAAAGWQLWKACATAEQASAGKNEANTMSERRVAERAAALAALEQVRRDWMAKVMTTQEDERRRFARELHDEMGQHIAGLTVGLQSLRLDASAGDEHLVVGLKGLVSDLERGVRSLARDLRPTALDDLGMVAALSHHVEEWSQQTCIAGDFCSLNCEQRLPSHVETTLYRIVQEALTNIARHAQARTASVVVDRRSDCVVVIIEDDGRGFDAARKPHSDGLEHFGLIGIRERAALFGGSVTIDSSPHNGTSLFVSLPLPERPEPRA